MDSDFPKEYLTLQNIGGSYNYSQITAHNYYVGTTVRTSFSKVRVDPDNMQILVNDYQFSSSTGSIDDGSITKARFGQAGNCSHTSGYAGHGNIDLSGSPFKVSDSFSAYGYLPFGSANFSEEDQVVSLSGGGLCGYVRTNNNETIQLMYID